VSPDARVLPAAGAPTLLHRLASLVDRLDPAALFPRAQPLEVELGSGDGSFLLAHAALHPERNHLGIERLLGRLRKLDRKGRRAGLTNLRGLRIEAAYALEYLLPPGGVAALHVYFPDPWPKRRHWRRRLVNDRFPDLAARTLAPGGRVFLRTDDAGYFAQMQVTFGASRAFRAVDTPTELAGICTDFEREFVTRAVPILRAAYERVAS
jgi:tRNA (guanine-N7-)-methyltransferase